MLTEFDNEGTDIKAPADRVDFAKISAAFGIMLVTVDVDLEDAGSGIIGIHR